MENDNIDIKLTIEEYKIILEALLFACSVDVSAKWYNEDIEKFKNICFRMRKEYPEILTESTKIVINQKDNFELYDTHTDEIMEYFPEMVEKIS